jgi:hypothetical protein
MHYRAGECILLTLTERALMGAADRVFRDWRGAGPSGRACRKASRLCTIPNKALSPRSCRMA